MAGAAGAAGVAHSGSRPTPLPQTSIFDFVFSNPFQHAKEYVPASQVVARIDDAQPIFVDNKSSMFTRSLTHSLTHTSLASPDPVGNTCTDTTLQTVLSLMAASGETPSQWPPTSANWA